MSAMLITYLPHILTYVLIILGVILSVQDYKTYSINMYIYITYIIAVSSILYINDVKYFFIPLLFLSLLWVKNIGINMADLIILTVDATLVVLLNNVIIVKIKVLVILLMFGAYVILTKVEKRDKIPYIIIGNILISTYFIYLLF